MHGSVHIGRLSEVCLAVAPRSWPLAFSGVLLTGSAVMVAPFPGSDALLAAGSALLFIWLAVRAVAAYYDHQRDVAVTNVLALVEADASPAILTDRKGEVLKLNPSGAARFGSLKGAPAFAPCLDTLFAAPEVVSRSLLEAASVSGYAWQDHESRNGRVRVSLMRLHGDRYLWRFEDLRTDQANESSDFALPALSVDGDGKILSMTNKMKDLLGDTGEDLSDIILDLPLRSRALHSVATQDGPKQIQVFGEPREDGGTTVYFMFPVGAVEGEDWTLFDTIPVPLLKLTPDGEVLQANRAARTLLEDPMPLGRQLQEMVAGLGRSVTDWLQESAGGRGLNQSEFLQLVNKSKDVFVQVTLKRVADGDQTALVAMLNDATELKTLEAQFVQSQKMQAIGQLAGGVAHDFNNLLTAISGHCDLLLMRHDQGDPNYGDLVQIHQNANRAASLVGQLLAFSRKQTLQPELIDLRDALSDLTHLLNRLVGEKVQLVLHHAPQLPPIRADKRQLEQVIMNLVVNARDAMPDGGRIEITTEAQQLNTEVHRNRAAIPPGDYAVITVRDEGMGIAPDKLPKIFEPFYTTKRTGEGTGLGLSTAYGIIKQTGGFIFADSDVDIGSLFTIYLPTNPADEEEEEVSEVTTKATPAVTKGAGVILLVEDEAPVRAFAARALRLRGYTVLEAENAEQALERLADQSLIVDIFVTDVVMPGLDGPSWVREALKDRPDTKVVFVSGYAEDALADQQARIPNSVFLPKPFSLKDLTATVQRQLH
ncbi:MAG: ATP-binding protein [Pseudomonadota bacterium]